MIEIYGADWCSFCEKAKELLDSEGLCYSYLDVDIDEVGDKFLSEYGKATLPQIKVEGRRIGGYTDLVEWLKGK